MRKINKNNMKLVASEQEGDLYSCYGEYEGKNKPLLFIRDRVTDKYHPTGMIYGLNGKLLSNDRTFNYYEERFHKPYVWIYRHNKYTDKSSHTGINIARSLMIALEEGKVSSVDVVGEGFGGIIGIYASLSSKIDQVVAIHPPILSEPVVNFELLKQKANTVQRKLALLSLKQIINDAYGYNVENINGYSNIAARCRLNKIKVVGSSIIGIQSLSRIDRILSEYLYDCTGYGNDGIVLWDSKQIERMGLSVVEDDIPVSHIKMLNDANYEKEVYKKLILNKM